MELVVEKKNESLDCIRKKKSHDKKEKVTSIFFSIILSQDLKLLNSKI